MGTQLNSVPHGAFKHTSSHAIPVGAQRWLFLPLPPPSFHLLELYTRCPKKLSLLTPQSQWQTLVRSVLDCG